ncbi:hypothetical protein [Nocardioides sp. L-11A]|uniref:hypothetical protein n=1 Tax=Nocardioides sp. L-11A TaxID=3043848 RepID=UPI00249A3CBC|nr:hypothetical protein QJ852_10145 [Nocardioides sp. L-11A]
MVVEGLALALELSEAGMQMRELRYRREHPGASDAEVEGFMRAWLRERPGASDGDAVGRRVDLPRSP